MATGISGRKTHAKRLHALAMNSAKEIARNLYAVGQNIEIDAERSITSGSISGKNHVPSKPGEPPNADTRFLDGNIETVLEDRYVPRVTVTSHAPYSPDLEYGTEKMEARPFMRPALEKNRENVAKAAARGVNTVLQGVKGE